MRGEVKPIYGVIAVICIVAIAAFFLWHAGTDRPAYPGMNAPQPGSQGGRSMAGPHGNMSQAQAMKMNIPGVSHPRAPQSAPPTNGGN